MRERGYGRIVQISSVAGRVTMPGMGAYAMSKHAVESMSQALRHELKPFGVAVSVIQPGGIDTPFAAAERRAFRHGRPDGPYAEFTAEVVDRLGRYPVALRPDRVARAVHRAATRSRSRPHYRVGGWPTSCSAYTAPCLPACGTASSQPSHRCPTRIRPATAYATHRRQVDDGRRRAGVDAGIVCATGPARASVLPLREPAAGRGTRQPGGDEACPRRAAPHGPTGGVAHQPTG
jgi:hypothetical protein